MDGIQSSGHRVLRTHAHSALAVAAELSRERARSRLATRIIGASNSGSTGQARLVDPLVSHPVPTGAISGAIG